ncbi:MAG TPA: SprT-like domain-containing protein [Polyangiaceae bacterium]|nr:SprT-like domain-containing protein [Polyangiaceae bacterium]
MDTHAHREATSLGVELEAKLLDRLIYEWKSINYCYFDDALQLPVLQLSDTRARLGQWHGELRSLEISRPLVLERPWAEVVEVLKHEVAHQYVDERLGVDEPAHGPTFQKICERLGIDGRATADPSRPDCQDDATDRIVARIRKLLALAQSPNQNEAETAATAARRLMLKFNIEVDQTRADDPASRRRYGYRHLGSGSGRILEHERRLAKILVNYFFVEGIWLPIYRPLDGKRGTVFEICGLEANLMMAEHVHAFLTATAERLWSEYKRTSKHTSNRDRQAYLAGVMRGFEAKLAAQSAEFQQQGLVWVPAPDLHQYFRRRYPKTTTVRRGGASRNQAYAEGNRAGRDIVLSQPVESKGSGGRPKALRAGG